MVIGPKRTIRRLVIQQIVGVILALLVERGLGDAAKCWGWVVALTLPTTVLAWIIGGLIDDWLDDDDNWPSRLVRRLRQARSSARVAHA